MKHRERGLKPNLRFPKFRSEPGWRERPLRAIAEPVSEKADGGADHNILTLSAEQGIVLQSEYFGKKIAGDNSARYIKIARNDFVYNDRVTTHSTYGTIKRLSKYAGGIVSPIYKCFRFRSAENPVFWEWYFESGAHDTQLGRLVNEGARAGRFNVSVERFLSTSVWYAPSPEQEKIANCLSLLDDVIAAQARKVEALKAHEKGLMHQLFPAEDKTRPSLRFPKFGDHPDWVSKTLGEIADISSGTTPLRSKPEFYDGGTIPWVKTTDLNNSFIDCTEECITTQARATVNPIGSVLVAMYGGFKQIGRTGYLLVPAATNQALSVLRIDQDEVLPMFVLFWLNAKVEDWNRIASSSRKDPNITGADVARFPIQFPKVPEQQQIADCLSSVGALIATQAQKLNVLEIYKKGLMQQLFPLSEDFEA